MALPMPEPEPEPGYSCSWADLDRQVQETLMLTPGVAYKLTRMSKSILDQARALLPRLPGPLFDQLLLELPKTEAVKATVRALDIDPPKLRTGVFRQFIIARRGAAQAGPERTMHAVHKSVTVKISIRGGFLALAAAMLWGPAVLTNPAVPEDWRASVPKAWRECVLSLAIQPSPHRAVRLAALRYLAERCPEAANMSLRAVLDGDLDGQGAAVAALYDVGWLTSATVGAHWERYARVWDALCGGGSAGRPDVVAQVVRWARAHDMWPDSGDSLSRLVEAMVRLGLGAQGPRTRLAASLAGLAPFLERCNIKPEGPILAAAVAALRDAGELDALVKVVGWLGRYTPSPEELAAQMAAQAAGWLAEVPAELWPRLAAEVPIADIAFDPLLLELMRRVPVGAELLDRVIRSRRLYSMRLSFEHAVALCTRPGAAVAERTLSHAFGSICCSYECALRVDHVRALLDAGACVDGEHRDGRPLCDALSRAAWKVVKLLLQRGAYAPDKPWAEDAVIQAARGGGPCFQLLVAQGACVTVEVLERLQDAPSHVTQVVQRDLLRMLLAQAKDGIEKGLSVERAFGKWDPEAALARRTAPPPAEAPGTKKKKMG